MSTLIKVDELYNKYSGQTIKNLSFKQTSINVLVGRSGSGKSTFIKHILADEQVMINSKNIIGYVPQNRGLFLNKSLMDNLLIISDILQVELNYDYLYELLDTFDLTNFVEYKISALSGGQRTKVAIIRALLSASEIIILDEPLSDLDEISKNELIEIFINLKQRFNKCLIVISHDLNNIIKVADQIIIFNQQKVFRYTGPLEQIVNHLE